MRKKSFLSRDVSKWALAFMLLAGGLIGQGVVPASAATGGGCGDCHGTVVVGFQASYHARIWQGGNTCQSCHGSTETHVANPTRQNVVSFTKAGGRAAAELSQACLSCHDASSHLNMWDAGAHNRNDVTCVDCHDIHTGRSAVNQPDVCFACHKSVKTQVRKQSHHPILEGKVACGDCHNPHGAVSHGMLNAENVNQLCYQCHADKRGPFIFEHPPVEEDCAICHTPHGSRHAKLMTEKIPNLCQDCHDWSRHPGTPYDATTGIAATGPSNRFFSRSCLNCHGAIHGSSHFENHGLTR